jgi:hypothetical protein
VGGHEYSFDRPGKTISVPPGQYWVKHIALQGGFQSNFAGGAPSRQDAKCVIVAPGRTQRLEIGAPLTATVTAKRRGSVLKLDYALVDAAGWKYSPTARDDPPWFKVYQDDREIGSGSFEYG